MKTYRALAGITRKGDGQTFAAGAEVDLELTAEEERLLIEQGVIKKIAPRRAKSKEEVRQDGEV